MISRISPTFSVYQLSRFFVNSGLLAKIPIGILASRTEIVNTKTIIWENKIIFETVSINDLLENINILIKYIISRKRKKSKN